MASGLGASPGSINPHAPAALSCRRSPLAGCNVKPAKASPSGPRPQPKRAARSLTSAAGSTNGRDPSSWTATEDGAEDGHDYLFELGRQSTNIKTTRGARKGMIDSTFAGDFLGVDADIASGELRHFNVRTLSNITGDYYIAPEFEDRFAMHVTRNYLADQLGTTAVPLVLGIWGPKGCGKSFQVELCCKKMGLYPIIMSAGELEDEWAGRPGHLIRQRYREAAQVARSEGKPTCLVINDLDAAVGWVKNVQMTVNNQMVMGTLMNICDNPNLVSVGQDNIATSRELMRIPVIVTANDLSTMYAPLLRDGRMDKFFWHPAREDLVAMVAHMFVEDGISKGDAEQLVAAFPDQMLDFFGALHARTYDRDIAQWAQAVRPQDVGRHVVRKPYDPPLELGAFLQEIREVDLEMLLQVGAELAQEQQHVKDHQLNQEYLRWQKQWVAPEKPKATTRKEVETAQAAQVAAQEALKRSREKSLAMMMASEKVARAERQARAEERAKAALKGRLWPRVAAETARELITTSTATAAASSAAPGQVAGSATPPAAPRVSQTQRVDVEEAHTLVENEGFTLLDVRSKRESNRETSKSALAVPVVVQEGFALDAPTVPNPTFTEQLQAAVPDTAAKLVVMGGAGGAHSAEALAALAAAGYADVRVMAGGYPAWSRVFTPTGVRRPQNAGAWKDENPTIWTDSCEEVSDLGAYSEAAGADLDDTDSMQGTSPAAAEALFVHGHTEPEFIMVDVRPQEEHLLSSSGALVWIPVVGSERESPAFSLQPSFLREIEREFPDRATRLLVCGGRMRAASQAAVLALLASGYTNTVEVQGGFDAVCPEIAVAHRTVLPPTFTAADAPAPKAPEMAAAQTRRVDVEEAHTLVENEGFTLLDVRSKRESNRETSKSALAVPVVVQEGFALDAPTVPNPTFTEQLQAAVPDTAAKLVVMGGAGGAHSAEALAALAAAGYADVRVMTGGYPAWSRVFTPTGVRRPQNAGAWKDENPTIWTDSCEEVSDLGAYSEAASATLGDTDDGEETMGEPSRRHQAEIAQAVADEEPEMSCPWTSLTVPEAQSVALREFLVLDVQPSTSSEGGALDPADAMSSEGVDSLVSQVGREITLPIVVMAPQGSEQAVVVNPHFATDVQRELLDKQAPVMVTWSGRDGRFSEAALVVLASLGYNKLFHLTPDDDGM